MSLTARVLAALVLGLAAGWLVLIYPAPALLAIVGIVEPIGTLWVNAIRMTVIPLVVSLLITGVASASTVETVRAIGLRALAAFVGLLALAFVVAMIVVPPLFSWLHIDAATATALRGTATETVDPIVPSVAAWVLALVPTNPIKAAADGAMLPLVVFTLGFALALLAVPPERSEPVVAFFRGLGDAMLVIVRVVIAAAPIGVFALMVPVASRTGLAAAGALGYYVVAAAVAQTILVVLLYPLAPVLAGIPVIRFARAVFPAQAVAISSSSSLASLPALMDGAERRLQLPAPVTGVVLPLAVASFKVAGPIIWLVAAVFLARLYGVTLSPGQQAVVAMTALLTSFSTPGVPHGWLLVIAPLVATMGIPAEGVGLLIAVDAVPDIFATTLNVTADMLAAGIASRRMVRGPTDS